LAQIATTERKNAKQAATRLCNPEPDSLEYIARMLLGPHLVVNRVLSGPNVRLASAHKARALEDLPEEVQHEEDGDVDVGREEVGRGPVAIDEDGKAIEDDDDTKVDEREPGRVWLPLGFEDEGVAVNVLRNQGIPEAQIGDANGHPCEELGNGDEVLEPQEDVVGTAGDAQVGEKGDDGSDGYAPDGDAGICALEEDLGRLTVLGDTEEVTGSSVEESVSGG